MKRWQYWIFIGLLWAGFLGGTAGIIFCLNPGWRQEKQESASSSEEPSVPGLEEEYLKEQEKRIKPWAIALRRPGGIFEAAAGAAAWKEVEAAQEGPAAVQEIPADVQEELLPSKEEPPVLYIASDLHYQSSSATDYGAAYEQFVAVSDGKVITYLPQLLDAFIDEMIQAKPDAFLLTGDITMNGERINHQELAEKLHRLQDGGVPVLIIPGNHDINNHWGRVFFGAQAEPAASISLEEFTDLYQDFGWNQAISRDEASFSYIYPLREDIWLMLLDTAKYDPVNLVEGEVRPETLRWMEENLERAKEAGIQVIVSGHYNLLQESRLFTTECVLENDDTVISLLETYKLPLYLSGHLHLQRIQKHKTEPGKEGYGIYEIVSDALSIPPCQYGILSWEETGELSYETRQVDVTGWAEKTGQTDENLLEFDRFKAEYVMDLIKAQILTKTPQVPEGVAEKMAQLYASIYTDYCAGIKIDLKEVRETAAYQNWLRYLPDSTEWKEMHQMMKDNTQDYNLLRLEPEP